MDTSKEYRIVRGRGRALQPEERYVGCLCWPDTIDPTGAVNVTVLLPDGFLATDTIDPECLEAV